ncbi:nucleotidyltransferase [Vagococcus sp. BWB3-3]|uniref:tRNA(Met) cytidine acetate ligase n=1 Tax=Vagococcus allomyrinae TaxID=2794353 RepID=A0A940PD39_9ENTE|nr:nucleotidyltransferase [Vagococcus allomyrinae]MBP1043876.1 nucleotidyltransferase [Vagococcus allomyrinae]
MKSCGVITEYNPFHNGHAYHLKKAREVSGAEVIVAIMSGNFLQRGEPAIIDKWQRAEVALAHGADIVIELPFAYAVQSADYFGFGGVKLLQALEVDSLCFGTDSEDAVDYQFFADFNQRHQQELEQAFQAIRNNGMSYPQQMTEVYRQLLPEWRLDFDSPNHILGMSYAKANQGFQRPMTLFPIKRQVTRHHQVDIASQEFASGTAIRKAILSADHQQLEPVMPETTYKLLTSVPLRSWELAWPLLKYQLTVSTVAQLSQCYQVVEGIEYRLKEMAVKATSFEEFVSLVKSKRFTWTRIQRLCTYLLIHVSQAEIDGVRSNSYLRVLGFNDLGRQFLGQQRKKVSLPLITKVSKANEGMLSLDIRAGQVYQLLADSAPQDYYRKPFISLG